MVRIRLNSGKDPRLGYTSHYVQESLRDQAGEKFAKFVLKPLLVRRVGSEGLTLYHGSRDPNITAFGRGGVWLTPDIDALSYYATRETGREGVPTVYTVKLEPGTRIAKDLPVVNRWALVRNADGLRVSERYASHSSGGVSIEIWNLGKLNIVKAEPLTDELIRSMRGQVSSN